MTCTSSSSTGSSRGTVALGVPSTVGRRSRSYICRNDAQSVVSFPRFPVTDGLVSGCKFDVTTRGYSLHPRIARPLS